MNIRNIIIGLMIALLAFLLFLVFNQSGKTIELVMSQKAVESRLAFITLFRYLFVFIIMAGVCWIVIKRCIPR
ncbi:hypothetical protein ACFL96_04765 [Thermoproteota archaeon]